MIWTEAEPRGSRWSDYLAPKMAARCSRINWPVPPLLLVLQSLILKNLSRAQGGEEAVLFTDVAFTFAWFSALACLWWDEESWMLQILLGDVGTEAPGISFLSHPRKWLLRVSVAFPTPSPSWPGCGCYQSLVSLASTLIFFCLCHFELSASCWKPKGDFQGLMARREAQRVFLTLQRREVKSQKKKKPPIQTHTNLLWLGLYWSLIDPYCCLFWTQSDGLWPSLTLMRSWVQAKNTATTCAVVTPQLGWKWPKDVFQSMNRALFCPAAWQEGSKRFKHY